MELLKSTGTPTCPRKKHFSVITSFFVRLIDEGSHSQPLGGGEDTLYVVGLGQMKYLVLARVICKFLLEDLICQYGCIEKILVDRRELVINEAKEILE